MPQVKLSYSSQKPISQQLMQNKMNRNAKKRACLGDRWRLNVFSLGCLTIACLIGFASKEAVAQGSREDYARSDSYDRRTRGLVFRDSVRPNWFGQQMDRFWYRIGTSKDSHQYVLVDTAAAKRSPAFDHDRLAAALSQQTETKVVAGALDLQKLAFADDLLSCQFQWKGSQWQFQLPGGPLLATKPSTEGAETDTDNSPSLVPLRQVVRSVDGGNRTNIEFVNRLSEPLEMLWVTEYGRLKSYGKVNSKSSLRLITFDGHAWVLRSPSGETVAAFVADEVSGAAVIDGDTPKPKPLRGNRKSRRNRPSTTSPNQKWRVAFESNNVVLIDLESDSRRTLTVDGDPADSYGGKVWWSPNSESFVVMKTRPGTGRKISMIDSAPQNSIHSQVITIDYAKPGDEIDRPRPVLFRSGSFQPVLIDDALFANPFGITDLAWRQDSSSFSFLYNQRGHQVLRLISVDADSARPRIVIDETSETFVCYSGKKFLDRIDGGGEVVWMSERSGWNHLYLIDFETGKVKNAITSGPWVVRRVEHVDVQQRQIWLQVSGIDPNQDPYHLHLVRVDFDGQNLTRLTEGDGQHQWSFSPGGQFIIDRYSRVDLPPITELRDSQTGRLLCVLEEADASDLLGTGWKYPERFVAKGRDGETDIHGIIIRPTHFDPQKRYPVLEAIYAGPQSAFVPKSFGRYGELYSMAELGFIVVKIDGMGTSHRSKRFHDVCWKNLADSGFPDRIAWIKAAAASRPEMDLSRVGIWGGSAGGQSAMRALIAHGDFYHAAVADCGCHDNRVDKIWWNEQWMGWPIGAHYQEQSNVTGASRLQGDLMLIWGELDRNVDPASSMQVVDALIKADKDFQLLIMPGVGHGAATHPYARRRQADFFVRKLWNRQPRHE